MGAPSVSELEERSASLLGYLESLEESRANDANSFYDISVSARRLIHALENRQSQLTKVSYKERVRKLTDMWKGLLPVIESQAIGYSAIDKQLKKKPPSVSELELLKANLEESWFYPQSAPYFDTSKSQYIKDQTIALLDILETKKKQLVSESYRHRVTVLIAECNHLMANLQKNHKEIPINNKFVRWLKEQAASYDDSHSTSEKLDKAYIRPTTSSDPELQRKLDLLRKSTRT